MVVSGAILLFIVIIALLFGCMYIHYNHKFKREEREKMIAYETAKAAIINTQWTKKVIIEKMMNASENVSEPLVSYYLLKELFR